MPPRSRPARLARRLAVALPAALVLGALAIAFNISFTAIIYRGELAPFLDRGIALALIGAAPMAVVGALALSYRGSVCQPQGTPAVVLAPAAAGIAAGIPGFAPEETFATVAALVVITTAASGLVAWLLGRLRLGFVARFIPFPVIAGFIAGIGYRLVTAGLSMTIHEHVGIWNLAVLLAPGNLALWLPWALLGAATALLMRRVKGSLTLPFALLAAGVGFYLVIGLLGIGLDEARTDGLLIGPFKAGGFLGALGDWQPLAVDWPAIAAETPSILTVIGLTSTAALLSASAIEVATRSQIDLNRDLRGIGLCNLAAAAGGGPVGYHHLSGTLAGHRMGSDGPLNGLSVAVACVIALTFGAGAIGSLPIGLPALLIVAVGLGMLIDVVVGQRRSLPAADYAVALIILGVTAAFGFVWGVAIGLLAAALFFIVTFARIDVIRLETNGARMQSSLERPAAEQARLTALGDQSLIYLLAGYLFFGTADRLVHRVRAALARALRPRFVLIDFRRVRGVDVSAARALWRLDETCRSQGTTLWLTGLDPASARLVRGNGTGQSPAIAESLEQALEQVEATLLAESLPTETAPTILDIIRDRHPGVDLADYLQTMPVAAGEEVIAAGAPSDFLLLLGSGLLRTEVVVTGAPPMTVARCLPGALVGEIGLYANVPRTARVVAEKPSEIVRIDRPALERLERDHPAVLADFHRLIASVLARRLRRTTALLADSEIHG